MRLAGIGWVRNAALAVGATLAALLLAELLLATLLPQRDRGVLRPHPFFGQYDPEIGWTLRPGAIGNITSRATRRAGLVEINAKGLRGPELPYERTPDRLRILHLGDSIPFGYALHYEESYPARLQAMLGDLAETVNAGVVGYGLDQTYLLFRREGVRYRPDVVVLGLTPGDMVEAGSSMRFGTMKPHFTLDEGGALRLEGTPVPERVPMRSINAGRPVRNLLFARSHLFRLLYMRLHDPDELFTRHVEVMSRQEASRVSVAILEALDRECRGIGAELLVVLIPHEEALIEAVSNPPGAAMANPAREMALDVLGASGVRYVDLWEPFYGRYADGARLFLEGDALHPNAEGCALIAEEILYSGLLRLVRR